MKQSQYVTQIAQPAYDALVAEDGGKGSAAWKEKAKELIVEHEERKASSYKGFKTNGQEQALAMKQLMTGCKKDASTAYAGGIHIAFVMASNIDAEATNKHNGLSTNSKVMEDFMLGALGNRKVFLPKLHAGVQNLGIVKESHGQDTTEPLYIEHFIHMSAQVKLPVKKKIHWEGFIKLLSLHSVQMYNWPRNLTLEDVFLLDYSCKDTTFWDALWVACQDDSTHQLGLQCLPSGTDVLVVMRVVTHCSQWPREWHLVQGSEVMMELNLKMSLLTTSINLPTIRMLPPVLLPPVLLPHLCHPPCPSTNTR